MKIPRDVSGERPAGILCRLQRYRRVHQSGSHIILETQGRSHQRLAVPDHDFLRVGTFNSLLKAVAAHKGVSREAIVATL